MIEVELGAEAAVDVRTPGPRMPAPWARNTEAVKSALRELEYTAPSVPKPDSFTAGVGAAGSPGASAPLAWENRKASAHVANAAGRRLVCC